MAFFKKIINVFFISSYFVNYTANEYSNNNFYTNHNVYSIEQLSGNFNCSGSKKIKADIDSNVLICSDLNKVNHDIHSTISPNINYFLNKIKYEKYSHYVLNHELGHAYIAIKNKINIYEIKVTAFAGYVLMSKPNDFVDLEVTAGGMAMEIQYGDEFLRMDQKDCEELLTEFNKYQFLVLHNQLILYNNTDSQIYTLPSCEASLALLKCFPNKKLAFNSLSKKLKLIFIKSFIYCVRFKYFINNFDKNLFHYLKLSLVQNRYCITSNVIEKFSPKEEYKDVALTNDDALIALNCMKKIFLKNKTFLSNLDNQDRKIINRLLNTHIKNNEDLYYLQDSKQNNIIFVCIFLLLCIILILIRQCT